MKVYDNFSTFNGNDTDLVPKEYYLKDKYGEIKRALEGLKEKYNEGTIDEDDYEEFADFLRDFFEENTEINDTNGYIVDIIPEKGTRKNNRIFDIFIFDENCDGFKSGGGSYSVHPYFPWDIELLEKKGLIYRDMMENSMKTLKVLDILKALTKANYYVSTKQPVICYNCYLWSILK